METFVTTVRGQIKIPKRQMSAQAKPVLQKPPPIKFKSAPPPEAKSNELSTLLKVVLGVSAWLYSIMHRLLPFSRFLAYLIVITYQFNHFIASLVKKKQKTHIF